MEDWVYRNLLKYGNCFIDINTYKKIGKHAILFDLECHGFECEINPYSSVLWDFNDATSKEIDYIITVKRYLYK